MKNMHYAAFLLLVIGGLNWLFVGLFRWDIGTLFGGQGFWLARLIYILIGAAAVYEFAAHKQNCKICASEEKK